MSLGLVGRKVGMTRIFADDGSSIPETVVDVSNNRVAQIKTPEVDGYAAVQVTFGKRRASRVNKAAAGHLAKAGVEAGEVLREFHVALDQLAGFKPGDVVAASIFSVGQKVDVSFVEQCPVGAFGVCRNARVGGTPYQQDIHYYGVAEDAAYLKPFCESQSKGVWMAY